VIWVLWMAKNDTKEKMHVGGISYFSMIDKMILSQMVVIFL